MIRLREAWMMKIHKDDEVVYKDDNFTVMETEDGWGYLGSYPAVAVLPFRRLNQFAGVEFLVRYEPVPVMGEGLQPWLVFGGTREHGSPEKAAIGELHEEAGYRVSAEDLIPLGEVYGNKHSNKILLFAVDVTDFEQGEAIGDGSEEEKDHELRWIDWDALMAHPASVLHTLAMRLYSKLY